MTLRSDLIRKSILGRVGQHPGDLVGVVAEEFGVSRQAIHRHIKILIEDGVLAVAGSKRKPAYALVTPETTLVFPLEKYRDEDAVWRESVAPLIQGLRRNVLDICHYGFTEMFNNAIDHSGGTQVTVVVGVNPLTVRFAIADDGVGVFERIRSCQDLPDLQTALLELSKGKLTTDPQNHTGQGIFFTSRMMDRFDLAANNLAYRLEAGGSERLLEITMAKGTHLAMAISADSERTLNEVFDRYSDVDYGFTKTHVFLRLARYGDELLVSRSQAKRVLARFDKFEEILLDFEGVESIGQAFADEIFRVFASSHPGTKIRSANTNRQIDGMIRRAVEAK